MNKEELTKQIEVLESELDKLKEQVNKPKKGWSPNKTGCWFVECSQDQRASMGVTHATKEDVDKHRKHQRLQNWLYQLALELNDGWEPDWGDSSQEKVSICYNNIREVYSYVRFSVSNTLGVSYFKNEETAMKALEIIKTWELDNAE